MRKLIRDCIEGDISFPTFKTLTQKVVDKYNAIYMAGSSSGEATLAYMKNELKKTKDMPIDRKHELLKMFYDWCGYEFSFEDVNR